MKSNQKVIGRIDRETARVTLTEANLEYGHFYLRSILSFFPEETIGGSDKRQHAVQHLEVVLPSGHSGHTDIAGPNRLSLQKRSKHYFFRNRRLTRRFFSETDAQEGDTVIIRILSEHRVSLAIQKKSLVI